MTGGASGGSRPGMDPAQMQLLVTGVREALDQVRKMRAVPRFRHTADASLFMAPDRDLEAPADR